MSATLIAGTGAAVAAVVGILSRPDPMSFITARGQAVDLFGAGIYRYDSLFSGAAIGAPTPSPCWSCCLCC